MVLFSREVEALEVEHGGLAFHIPDPPRVDVALQYMSRVTSVVQSSDGRNTKYYFDKMIYVVASQQDLHLSQFFKMLSLMEFPWADLLEHVDYGSVLGMSTRKGTAVVLDQIIREASLVMHERNEVKYNNIEDSEMVARELGIVEIKIQDMAAKR
ncbi:hypothetical protein BDR04DRAFT_388289 [Suillus decipiens]|nr:hypothetical protein BDR04DRAFT_388289 [Suillus decipiens]